MTLEFVSNQWLYFWLLEISNVFDEEIISFSISCFFVLLLDVDIDSIDSEWLGSFSISGTFFSFELEISIAKWVALWIIGYFATKNISEDLESFFELDRSSLLGDIGNVDLLLFVFENSRIFDLFHDSNVVFHDLLTIRLSSGFLSIFLLKVSDESESSRSSLPFMSHDSHWKDLPEFLKEVH